MNNQIFINYRREDSSWSAGRIYDNLLLYFDKNQIFIDVDSIGLGDDFIDYVENSIKNCDVLLAIIGSKWLEIIKQKTNQIDFVRLEIAAALKNNIKIIPILVEDAKMPSIDDLPEEIKFLSRKNAFLLSHISFNNQIEKLAVNLKKNFSQKEIDLKKEEERLREFEQKVKQKQLEEERQRQIEQEVRQKQVEEEILKQKQFNEEDFWKQVNTIGTANSYRKYIQDYPKGKYYNNANQQISFLKEELNEESKLEKLKWWKYFKTKHMLVAGLILIIFFLIWFLSSLKGNAYKTTKSDYEDNVTKAFSDSLYGKEIKATNHDSNNKLLIGSSSLHYTNKIDSVEAERVVNFMVKQKWDVIMDTITYQLDSKNDTILFKYNLYNKDEATTAVKNSMQEFGNLLSDSLFNDRLLKVMAYNINDKVEYFSYIFGANDMKNNSISSASLKINNEEKDKIKIINMVDTRANFLGRKKITIKNLMTLEYLYLGESYEDYDAKYLRTKPQLDQKSFFWLEKYYDMTQKHNFYIIRSAYNSAYVLRDNGEWVSEYNKPLLMQDVAPNYEVESGYSNYFLEEIGYNDNHYIIHYDFAANKKCLNVEPDKKRKGSYVYSSPFINEKDTVTSMLSTMWVFSEKK